MTTIYLNAKPVSRSRNLRGILDYARRHGVQAVDAFLKPKGAGELRVVFCNGARVTTDFASYSVMCHFLRHRRSWPQDVIRFGGRE